MQSKVVHIILAAGQSRRFGARNKLLALYKNRPVASHIAQALQTIPALQKCAVTREPHLAGLFKAKGFKIIHPPAHPRNQSTSLKSGLGYAQKIGASHILLTLADMPEISQADLRSLSRLSLLHPVLCRANGHMSPPALIPASRFPMLRRLQGDQGAGKFLRKQPDLICLTLNPRHLRDIDLPTDLTLPDKL